MRWLTMITLGIALSTAGCGKKDDDNKGKTKASKPADKAKASASSGPKGACDRRAKEFICAEYHGKLASASFIDGECKAYKVPRLAACPTEGVIGRCVRWAGTAQEAHEVYYKGGEKKLAACEVTKGKRLPK